MTLEESTKIPMYNHISDLQRDRDSLKVGQRICFRGELMDYRDNLVTYLITTRDDEELGGIYEKKNNSPHR